MKILSHAVAATFSLLSFSAFAGGNCLYGHDKNLVQTTVEDALLAEQVDPGLLAKLKKQQDDKEQIKPINTFN